METRLSLAPGQNGTKKLLARYGDRLQWHYLKKAAIYRCCCSMSRARTTFLGSVSHL